MSRLLRPFQAEALSALRSEIHLVLTAPTGSGKGVVLEELARNPKERILLVTPLIALARQQGRRFSDAGVSFHSSVALGGAPDPGPNSDDRVWILGPEAALAPRRSERIREWNPTLVAIDEAHCLEEWGESFRPAYHALVDWIAASGWRRTLWMSATFPRSLATRLRHSIEGEWRVHGSFSLPTRLDVRIERVEFSERVERVRSTLLSRTSPGILFCGTRKTTENYVRLLASDGFTLLPYHAGLADEERRAIEAALERERAGRAAISISATNAFGMGMDFPQLEWTLIAQAPFSVLSLMQAFGRVGRGGRTGIAEILWAEEDFRIAGYLVSSSAKRESAEDRLAILRRYLESDSAEPRRRILSDYFV